MKKMCQRCKRNRVEFEEYKYCHSCAEDVKEELKKAGYLRFIPFKHAYRHASAKEKQLETKKGTP